MSILKKFLILISLFLYIFSIKITKIEPSKIPIGNNQDTEITLTYEGEYGFSDTFYIGDQVNMYLIVIMFPIRINIKNYLHLYYIFNR